MLQMMHEGFGNVIPVILSSMSILIAEFYTI